ncbi:hypothetical protein BSL78_24603 [Apostichopus japonicus]|uniref:Uncharacterized protein n=1 Tax=Stichopus japonicus TaxID=307972 RepID=A0A2G8JS15_STIJA|nr:hypothetical protein BSL78_24603 [Apostichopus japonicus]
MMTSYDSSKIKEDTRYILNLLLLDEGLSFNQRDDVSILTSSVSVGTLQASPGTSWSDQQEKYVPPAATSSNFLSPKLHDVEITEAPFTKETVYPEYTPGASKHYKQDQLDKIAEEIKRIGDQLNPKIEKELQNLLLKKVLLSSSQVAYSTFEEWIKEFLTEHQYSLVDKSDKYKVHLFLMCVKLSLKTATKQLHVTSNACQRLYDFSVNFVVINFPNWMNV